jgi:prepilin-type N-terminal cleavage/methylation domain-containing protein
MLKNKNGFTLTELMIVIVIIGILSMLAIPKFMGTTTKAKLAEFPAILMQIYSLQDGYLHEMDKFATDLKQLDFTDPESKYFDYTLESDGSAFIAKATVKVTLKDGQGNDLMGEYVSLNQKKEHGGSENLRRVARW